MLQGSKGHSQKTGTVDAPNAPTNTNDRFAVLAPSSAPSRGGANTRGGYAERMKQGAAQPVASGGSVADRMRHVAAPPASEKNEGQASRARDEVFVELKALLDSTSTIQLSDFDYRVRQHLHALLGSGGRERLHQALEAIKTATSKKTRKDVKNWPAYLGKLLKTFDGELGWKDREARARARIEKAATESVSDDRTDKDSEKTSPRELSEEDAWMEALSKGLSDEDQWLSDFAQQPAQEQQTSQAVQQPAAGQPQKQALCQAPLSPPPMQPPKQPVCQAPTQPPPQQAPRCNRQMQGPPHQSALMGPPTMPPTHEPVLPPTPSKTSPMQTATTPPAKPPMFLPDSDSKLAPQVRWPSLGQPAQPTPYFLSIEAQKLLLQFQQQQNLQGFPPKMAEPPTTLNFPLEAWATWLYPPPQYQAPQCTAR